jgi:Zn-finger in ubiquitin-hydrolases and other protein
VCEDCVRDGREDWVSLRRCLSCGHIGCCDSSPGLHATAHHRATGHPMVRATHQDWVWCYVDEITLRHTDGDWVEIDLFYEAGLAYMREHISGGDDSNVAVDHVFGKGFPLGPWVVQMRRRHAAGELSAGQVAEIEQLAGWRWNT